MKVTWNTKHTRNQWKFRASCSEFLSSAKGKHVADCTDHCRNKRILYTHICILLACMHVCTYLICCDDYTLVEAECHIYEYVYILFRHWEFAPLVEAQVPTFCTHTCHGSPKMCSLSRQMYRRLVCVGYVSLHPRETKVNC